MLTFVAAVALSSWITTWAATPAPRWGQGLPPFDVSETLTDQTVRQILRASVGGRQLRIVISNEFGTRPLTIGAASVAVSAGAGAIERATLKPVLFHGKTSVVIPPGAPFVSDPVALAVKPLSSLAISLYFPKTTQISSVHWDGLQTGYISAHGDETRSTGMAAVDTTHSRLLLSGVEVDAQPHSSAVVFFGDSITDGAGSKLDANHRWPDYIAERGNIAVVNEAYSGNRLLADGMGTNALARFDRSVLSHPRVSTVVVLLGINDIGWPGAVTPDDPEPSAEDLIAGYKQIVERAHEHGIRVIIATLTPFAGALSGTPLSGYYTPEKDAIRDQVNAWIRGKTAADGLIDFDSVLRDPQNPKHLNPAFDCGDHLHPNDTGYQAMARAVSLNLLVRP
jgi:lysophospholipase L1-like esterase